MIDDKCFAMRLALAKEKKKRESAEEMHAAEVSEKIGTINNKTQQGLDRKLDDGSGLVRHLTDKMQDLREQLREEQRQRDETERTMLHMLDDVVGKIKDDLRAEMKDREATEEMLLRLLEETCSRVQVAG